MTDERLHDYLESARARLRRVSPDRLEHEIASGALLVDIRPYEIREEAGPLPGALVVGLNVLEWRLAPSSPHRIIELEPDRRVILVCQEGYSSSLAAARLQDLGVQGATDLIGGFAALGASEER